MRRLPAVRSQAIDKKEQFVFQPEDGYELGNRRPGQRHALDDCSAANKVSGFSRRRSSAIATYV